MTEEDKKRRLTASDDSLAGAPRMPVRRRVKKAQSQQNRPEPQEDSAPKDSSEQKVLPARKNLSVQKEPSAQQDASGRPSGAGSSPQPPATWPVRQSDSLSSTPTAGTSGVLDDAVVSGEVAKRDAGLNVPGFLEKKAEPAGSDGASSDSASASRFERWRSERDQQREAEIAREEERVQQRRLRDQMRQDPALDGLRAEEKAKPKRARLSRARTFVYAGVALLVVSALYIGVVFFSPLLAVEKVTVRGTSLMDGAQVEQRLSSLRGVPLSRVNESRVRELIGSDGALRGVQIEVNPPHELVVTVKERVPIAALKRGDRYVLVDNEGVELREVGSPVDAQVPLLQISEENLGQSETFRMVANVLVTLPTSILSEVSDVKADSTSSINLVLKDKVTVKWGTSQNNEVKAKVLTKLLEATRGENADTQNSETGGSKISVYDVSSPQLPVTR